MNILGIKDSRVNRLNYFLTIMFSMFVFVAVGVILGYLFNALFGPIDPASPDSPHPLGLIPFMVFWYVYFIIFTIKRLHDMNASGWLSLLLLIPYAGFIFTFVLFFVKGSVDSNKYGSPDNGTRILGIR